MNTNFIHKLILILFVLGMQETFATHYRAGEILYEYLGPQTYRVEVVTYTEIGGGSNLADQDSIDLNWGDGTIEKVLRVNGPLNGNGFPDGEILTGSIKKNIYRSDIHTYAGALPYYIISIEEQNRIADIVNISGGSGSDNVPFYLEDTLEYIPPELLNGNSSPILLNPPIDYANVLDTFRHNPNAYDPDGDSLNYSLVPSLQSLGLIAPLYVFPDQIGAGANNNISIDPLTGDLVWATPQVPGEYNVAIKIKEYRDGFYLGALIRDMQILVGNEQNDPPQIKNIKDTCVYGGDTLNINIEATDPNALQTVTLTADGAPFQIDLNRTNFSSNSGNPATATFQWQTICSDIRPSFYEIIFKAEDNYETISGDPAYLVDLETWLVHVIPPPPDSLYLSASNNDIQLNWDDPYRCYDDVDFQYFSVWRKYGCENMDRLGCETGLNNTGYEMIADNITSYDYLDLDLDRGHVYSYRILAHFGTNPQSSSGAIYNVQESVPSHEVCVELPLDLPVITNVSVEATDETNGVIFVQWSKPRAGVGLLDTLIDQGPYVYELYRSEGFTGNSFSLIETFTSATFSGFNDTLFYDSLLNTVENPYSYKVVFKAENGAEELGETSIASSIYLTVNTSDQSLVLTWEEDVPWVNDTFTIFKYDPVALVFDSLDITTLHEYTDIGLENDSTYCYLIRSKGKYFSTGLINPIINFSQEDCGTPKDTTAPCSPDFSISNDCDLETNEFWDFDNFQNRISIRSKGECSEDVSSFLIYYQKPEETEYNLIIETSDTFFIHQLINTISGCYIITAKDEAGNESELPDTVCIENCAIYNLPNVFTPNADGDNDYFIPFPGWRFVQRIDMKVYGRWGNLVFETSNPAINWDGTDVSGQKLHDGVYMYQGYYYVKKLDGTEEEIVLPPNDKGGGVIQIINGK